MAEELLTLRQVAEELQLHVDTVRDWVREKKLNAIKLSAREYRVRRSDLNKFLQERQTKSGENEQTVRDEE